MANEFQVLHRPGQTFTARATGSITGRTFVDISATEGSDGLARVATASAGAKALGVAGYDAASGAALPIFRGGVIGYVTAGGSITAGAEIEVGSSGRAITLASGKAVGKALSTGTNGNAVRALIY